MKFTCFQFMLKSLLIFVLLFSLTWLNKLYAIEVTDLYQAKVMVSSQSKNQRNNAQKKAMQAVMVKVGGQESVLNNSIIKKALRDHKSYVSQYSYVREAFLNSDLNVAGKQAPLMLLVRFDENKINQLFQQANLSLWGSLRPQVLLWLIEENNLSRQILSESSLSAYPTLIKRYSNARGLPVIMPLMDLTDTSQIKLTDVWGRFIDPVTIASTRYGADAMVIVRVSNASLISIAEDEVDCRPLCQQKQYALDWTLVTENQLEHQRTFQQYQGTDTEQLLQQAISDIVEVIYQEYALTTNSNNELLIDVANVDSVGTYMKIINFLDDLSSVQSTQLVSVNGTNRRFNLTLIGSKQALLSSLKLNKKLKQYIDPLAEIIPDAVPVFYWDKP